MKISPINGRVRINLNVAASTKNTSDVKSVYYLAQRLGSTNYSRYGSTMEFYIPVDKASDFKTFAQNRSGLDFYI